jgi:hypothetical protein
MIKTLVSIEVDLASNMAIRYACHLGNIIPMELYPVYVKYPEFPITGAGWARRTCPVLKEPRVVYGDRDTELLKILEEESFDLYIEGAPYPFNPTTITQRLHRKLYERINIPFIWLRVIKKVNQILVLANHEKAVKTIVPVISRLMSGSRIPIHLGILNKNVAEAVATAKDELINAAHDVAIKEIIEAAPQEVTKDYGMVAASMERTIKKDHPFLQWIAQVKSPIAVMLANTT